MHRGGFLIQLSICEAANHDCEDEKCALDPMLICIFARARVQDTRPHIEDASSNADLCMRLIECEFAYVGSVGAVQAARYTSVDTYLGLEVHGCY